MRRYQNGDDLSKWWIVKSRSGSGNWFAYRPANDSPSSKGPTPIFSSGAEAIAAFARGSK